MLDTRNVMHFQQWKVNYENINHIMIDDQAW